LFAAPLAVAVTTVILFLSFGRGGPPILENGGFETGDLTGWSTESWGSGEWLVYLNGTTPPDPSISDMDTPFDVPDPPEGRYAAVSDMNYSGVRFLYRDIEVTAPWTLRAIVFYENHGAEIHDKPDFGSFYEDSWSSGFQNQQYRIDLVDPGAPIHSLEPDEVLATVFWTRYGDPSALGPTPVSVDLAPWEGQTIRLRITQTDNMGPLRAGIDDVRLERGD
jgi:hypothetical protein